MELWWSDEPVSEGVKYPEQEDIKMNGFAFSQHAGIIIQFEQNDSESN